MDKAVIVGINSYPSCPLRGCVNDAQDMASFLVKSRGFKQENVQMLCDSRATTRNIIDNLNWLAQGVQAGDRVYFHYSGHGAQVPSYGKYNEADGLLEVICPVDFDWAPERMLNDKQLVQIFAKIPAGVKFNWGSDSCHSGDLSRDFVPPDSIPRAFPVPPDIAWAVRATRSKFQASRAMVGNILNVGYISGCKSNQTSADAVIGGRSCGAMTHFLLQVLNQVPPTTSTTSIVGSMVPALSHAGYSQVPQAEGARCDQPFLV